MGAAAGSTLALALLVCGCVFAALAGPALSQHTRTLALHQTLAGLTATTKTVQVGPNWADFTGALVQNGVGTGQNMTAGEFAETTREIGHGFAALGLPLAAGQWAGLTRKLFIVSGAGPRTQTGAPPKLEVLYRDPLTSNAQLTAGTYAGAAFPAGMVGVAATHADGRAVRVAPGEPPVGGDPVRPGRALRHRDTCGNAPLARPSGRKTRPRARRRSSSSRPRARRSGWAASSPTRTSSPRCRTRSTGRPGAELGIPA